MTDSQKCCQAQASNGLFQYLKENRKWNAAWLSSAKRIPLENVWLSTSTRLLNASKPSTTTLVSCHVESGSEMLQHVLEIVKVSNIHVCNAKKMIWRGNKWCCGLLTTKTFSWNQILWPCYYGISAQYSWITITASIQMQITRSDNVSYVWLFLQTPPFKWSQMETSNDFCNTSASTELPF